MHSILDLLRNWLLEYGYWAVGIALLLENAGVPVPGETILILASVLAYSDERLHLPSIIVVATLAATTGDNIGYWIGLKGGRPLLEHWKHFFRVSDEHIAAAERLLHKYGAFAIFIARFVAGARIVAGPLAGVLRMSWKRFFVFNALGAITWVSVISSVSYAFGSQFERILTLFDDVNKAVIVIAVVAVIILLIRRKLRQKPSY